MSLTYLWPREPRSGARHLTIRAHQRGSAYLDRWVPLCGQDRGRTWPIIGDWSDNWPTAKDSPLCSRCLKVLAELNEAAQQ